MNKPLTHGDLSAIETGFDAAPDQSRSLPANWYTDPRFLELERREVFCKTWQFAGHVEKIRQPGQYMTIDVQGHSIAIIRDRNGELRAFFNVCQHRAHALLQGDGTLKQSNNTAYDASNAEITDHVVWWLWPTTCLLRFSGSPNFWVLNVIPISADETYEAYDFFLAQPTPSETEMQGIEYVDKVLQPEDIDIVESVQRGMNPPGYDRGYYVTQTSDSGYGEHAVQHFHSLLVSAYQSEPGSV